MDVIYIGIDTATDISHLQRSVIIPLQMKRDDAFLGIYALDGSLANVTEIALKPNLGAEMN